MRGADGVEAGGFQELHSPLLGAIEGGRAQRAVIVVDAAAGHFHQLAVQQKALFDGPLDRADAEGRGHLIDRLLASHHPGDGSVKAGRLRRPERRLGDGDFLGRLDAVPGASVVMASAWPADAPDGPYRIVRTVTFEGALDSLVSRVLTADLGLNRAHLGGRDVHAPLRHVHRFGDESHTWR